MLYPLWKNYYQDRTIYKKYTTLELLDIAHHAAKEGNMQTFHSAFVLSVELEREKHHGTHISKLSNEKMKDCCCHHECHCCCHVCG